MTREKLTEKIKNELESVVIANEATRRKNLDVAFEKLKEEVGTLESCFMLQQLVADEDDLRKVKDNLHEWTKSVNLLTSMIEKGFDSFYYEVSYEFRDTYSFWIVVNGRMCLCIEFLRARSREMDLGCEINWGIIDRQRCKYTDKFAVYEGQRVCTGSFNQMNQMLSQFKRECRPIKLKKKN